MFFFRMVLGIYKRQWKKMLMICLTVILGASIATAMLNVMLDVGDKINEELKTYGANITVESKAASVVNSLYEFDDDTEPSIDEYIKEENVPKIKTIFWAYNITDLSPFIETKVKDANGNKVKVVGSWFNHHSVLASGDTCDSGITNLRTWWDIESGAWMDEQADSNRNVAMVGTTYAKTNNVKVGDTISLTGKNGTRNLLVKGIFDSGDDDDSYIYTYLDIAQDFANMAGYVKTVEVSALTTPDNDLAKKAAADPDALSVSEYELWYCTAYVSSICYQIEEAIPDVVASAVRQIADSEGDILEKTELLMTLITVLSLVAAALGISNLVTSSVMERSQEIGLMKAVGAKNSQVTVLVLLEIMLVAVVGAVVGYFLGYGFAQIIGWTVFGSAIDMSGMVAFVVAVLIIGVTLLGSLPAIRTILRLRPSEVLHGR